MKDDLEKKHRSLVRDDRLKLSYHGDDWGAFSLFLILVSEM